MVDKIIPIYFLPVGGAGVATGGATGATGGVGVVGGVGVGGVTHCVR